MSTHAAPVAGAFSPEQATFLLHKISLPTLHNEHATTKRVIEAIPLDRGDFRPDTVARTAIELAWHIAVAEHRFLDAVASGEFNLTPIPRPESTRNSADVAAWYAESFAKNFQRLEQLSGVQLLKPIDFRGLLLLPAIAYLQLGMNHTIHHRGQLSTYLRPMGGKVPSIYGESYDSTEARKAKEGASAASGV
jgi:uncharacterized damage-inducible protein DinB